MCILVTRAVIFGLLLGILCPVEAEKWWPDFSCHPAIESSQRRRAISFNRMGWRNCVEYNEKSKAGICPKVCVLVDEKLVYQKKKPDGPVIFDTDKFVKHFADELGYNADKPEGAEKQRMNQVRSGLDDCKQKHSEYEGLKNLKSTPCEPWSNFLLCIDKILEC